MRFKRNPCFSACSGPVPGGGGQGGSRSGGHKSGVIDHEDAVDAVDTVGSGLGLEDVRGPTLVVVLLVASPVHLCLIVRQLDPGVALWVIPVSSGLEVQKWRFYTSAATVTADDYDDNDQEGDAAEIFFNFMISVQVQLMQELANRAENSHPEKTVGSRKAIKGRSKR